jgi:two-component system response regulator YesN
VDEKKKAILQTTGFMTPYTPSSHELAQIKQTACFIEESIQQHYTIKQLARKFKLSVQSLKLVFKQEYGMGTHAYLKTKRMDKAREMLLNGVPHKVIIATIGYENETTFCRAFKDIHNETPVNWKKQQLDKDERFR